MWYYSSSTHCTDTVHRTEHSARILHYYYTRCESFRGTSFSRLHPPLSFQPPPRYRSHNPPPPPLSFAQPPALCSRLHPRSRSPPPPFFLKNYLIQLSCKFENSPIVWAQLQGDLIAGNANSGRSWPTFRLFRRVRNVVNFHGITKRVQINVGGGVGG